MTERRFFINGRFLEQRVTGVQRFAIEVTMALDELLDGDPSALSGGVTIVAPRGARTLPLRRLRIEQVGPLHGHAWEQCTLPLFVGGAPLLSLCPTGPVAKRNQVVTIHDAAVRANPQAYSARFRGLYNALLPSLIGRSRCIMTVSEFSKSELIKYYSAPAGRIRVTGEGWQHVLRVEPDERVLSKHGLSKGQYVLAVSSVTPNKNIAVVARALARLPKELGIQVVLAGAFDQRLFADARIPQLEALRWLGYVSDGELRALYENATAFVFPSFYEGFGLPPLEAMGVDCPVLCSNAASIPEVCGDAALYFDPRDDAALADLMRRLFTDPGERERLVLRGRERISRFSWKSTAQRYLSLFREWVTDEAPLTSEWRGEVKDSTEAGSVPASADVLR